MIYNFCGTTFSENTLTIQRTKKVKLQANLIHAFTSEKISQFIINLSVSCFFSDFTDRFKEPDCCGLHECLHATPSTSILNAHRRIGVGEKDYRFRLNFLSQVPLLSIVFTTIRSKS